MNILDTEKELRSILQAIIDREASIEKHIKAVHKDYKLSAKNLYRYLVLRSFDLRNYHDTLSDLGLSSIRSSEGYVYSNLYSVLKNLCLIKKIPFKLKASVEKIGYRNSKKLLKKHANSLFNQTHNNHFTEIMVTLPDEAADDKEMIKEMALSGMEIARINLSHGDVVMWTKMVSNLRKVKKETGLKIKIYMDLSGPKIRTSSIEITSSKGKTKNSIPVRLGEHLLLTKMETKGKASVYGKLGEQIDKAIVGVLLPQIIDDAKIGDLVLFDDGMIRAIVVAKSEESLELKITHTYKGKLGGHKGINLPNTVLNLPALTESDLENLTFVCKNADIVGYSFVRTGADVLKLYESLQQYDAKALGVVFKIENKEAFENLPEILIAGMQRNSIGVMIARGDLAVEIGFERISEVQNQILWLCEAAHVPVIWATQVLENLAKTGMPTRAEISDAALGVHAECVMLNKGPYIIEAIKVLKNILIRMEGHSFKKKNELRALNLSKKYVDSLDINTLDT